MTQDLRETVAARLKRPLRLTRAGLWAERLTRSFWPLWTVLITTLALLAFGLQDFAPLPVVWAGLGLAAVAALAALWRGWRSFVRPTLQDALHRLDATLPGRPIATLADTQAIGASDPASQAVWAAHLARMARAAATARPVAPDLRLATRDPFGLRYIGLTALVMALMFGSVWRVASVAGLDPTPAQTLANGPSWEGWVQPPPYTGKPALYLQDIDRAAFEVPAGSRVQLRFYGEVGALTLAETVSGKTNAAPNTPTQDFEIVQNGRLTIDGPGGRAWDIIASGDAPPTVSAKGELTREADGRLKLPFEAKDDFGVTGGTAVISLDMASLDRRYGLTIDPENTDPVTLDLPLPISGQRTDFSETLVDDLSQHVFANLPVTITLSVTDAAGQTGAAPALHVTLPGKRFFDPMAAAIIELRRDLLWSRSNAPRTAQIFKALTHRPEGLILNEKAYLRLRVALRQLESNAKSLSAETRDELAAAFWDIALMIEEGDLNSARERLKRAQDQLDEAIRNGADPAEIDKLMEELRQAMDDYMRQLAQEAERNPNGEAANEQETMEITGDQLQQMLQELQKLLEEGKMDEAAQLMEMLRQLMENMQITQGEGGQGGPGQQAMKNLGDTLRDQQELSDDSFSELQNPGQQDGQDQDGQTQDGQDPRPGEQGQQGTPDTGDTGQNGSGKTLQERQSDLRDRLGRLNGNMLPGAGSEQGEAGRQSLDKAERSMEEAERALRDGDLPGALDKQADAMQTMREGIRQLGDAMAQERRENGTNNGQGEAVGRADPNAARDPLGRETGEGARIGSDRNLLQGNDVYRRAQDLLDEIRRRQGDQTRPDSEREYLQRLLDMY